MGKKSLLQVVAALSSFILLSGIFLSAVETRSAHGADSANEWTEVREGLDKKIALDLRNMDVLDTLNFLSKRGNINIIVNRRVSGRVSLFLEDVTIRDALEIILIANDLAYEIRENILYVMTDDEYVRLHGASFKDDREVRMFELRYARPRSVFEVLNLLKSDIGKLIVDEESGVVVVVDTPRRIAKMEKALANVDRPLLTETFVLQYAEAEEVAAVLNRRLDIKQTGTVSVDARTNQVIVSALPERMKEVKSLIPYLDRETKQVLLEVKMLQIELKDEFAMGVDWKRVWEGARVGGIDIESRFPMSERFTDRFQMGLTYGRGQYSYEGVASLLQDYGDVRNLSSPSIAALHGETAKMHVGWDEAYVTTTIEMGATAATTAAQVQFMKVGVLLEVTPEINDERFVTMHIRPEVSNVIRTLEYSIQPNVVNKVPIVGTTTAETSIKVKDGTTIIIGGLRKDDKTKEVRKVPLLGDIPLLGAAFRRIEDTVQKTEVVVFITPRIISGDIDVHDEEHRPKPARTAAG